MDSLPIGDNANTTKNVQTSNNDINTTSKGMQIDGPTWIETFWDLDDTSIFSLSAFAQSF